jgi:hypothetical protein
MSLAKTLDVGSISHKKITEMYRSKFKAKPSQTPGEKTMHQIL